MALCWFMRGDRLAACQKANREARTERIELRQGGRTSRTRSRQKGRTSRTLGRQEAKSERVETRVEGGATFGQALAAGVGAFAPPAPSYGAGAGGLSYSTVLIGGAAIAAALLLSGDDKKGGR